MPIIQLNEEINNLCYRINGICMAIHNEVGPGFPEEYYQKALEIELTEQHVHFEPQKPIPVLYRGIQLGLNYLDFLIGERIILEIKSVHALSNVHLFQVLKYLGYTGLEVALLINFGRDKLEYKRVLPTQKMMKFREEKRT